jgi:hypothetical protein
MSDFEEALRAKVAADPLPGEDEATTPEDEEPESSAEEESSDEEEEPQGDDEWEEEEEEEEPEELDLSPEARSQLQELAKEYDGDVAKALGVALNAQGLIGRQGDELGQLRKAVEELREQVNQPPQTGMAMPPFDFAELVEERPHEAAAWAFSNGRMDLYDQAMETWYEENPRMAGRFERALEMHQLREEIGQEINPALSSSEEARQQRDLAQAQEQALGVYPDLVEVLNSATQEDLTGFPREAAEQLQQGDVVAKAEALKAMYLYVQGVRSVRGAPRKQKSTEAGRQKKRSATVARASSQPAREGKSAKELLREQFSQPDPTSVLPGPS